MLYTKKGDQGTTKLFDSAQGVRVSKTSYIFESLGTIDELNSAIGYAKTLIPKEETWVIEKLEQIQQNLFTIQAELAGAPKFLTTENVKFLEDLIAEAEKEIPEINSFIISGGTPPGAFLDFVRTIARRGERVMLRLKEEKTREIKEDTYIYLNRLSSALYALARYINHKNQIQEKSPDYK